MLYPLVILSLAKNNIRKNWFVTFAAADLVGQSKVLNWSFFDSDLKPGLIDSIFPTKQARLV